MVTKSLQEAWRRQAITGMNSVKKVFSENTENSINLTSEEMQKDHCQTLEMGEAITYLNTELLSEFINGSELYFPVGNT